MDSIKKYSLKNCMSCHIATYNGYVFCENCTPLYGQRTVVGSNVIYVGSIPFVGCLKDIYAGRFIIKWWVGTDALTMRVWPPGKGKLTVFLHRVKMRLLSLVIQEHWLTGPRLADSLGKINLSSSAIVYWPGKMHCPVEKKAHDGFNVIYYHPANSDKYKRWVYGVDILDGLREKFPNINWIRLDGSQDMREVYPTTDLYVRPSRHDGDSRMIRECQLNEVPVIYSEDGSPMLSGFIEGISNELDKLRRNMRYEA